MTFKFWKSLGKKDNTISSRDGAEKGISRSAESAAKWNPHALDALHSVAKTQESFTSDAVWDWLANANVKAPYEPRAMGAIMRNGVKNGWITRTDEWIVTDNPATSRNHGRPQRVYTSNLL